MKKEEMKPTSCKKCEKEEITLSGIAVIGLCMAMLGIILMVDNMLAFRGSSFLLGILIIGGAAMMGLSLIFLLLNAGGSCDHTKVKTDVK